MVMNQLYKKIHQIIPYGREWIDKEDIRVVVDVLRSNFPLITFVAIANRVVFQGATPVFADVE